MPARLSSLLVRDGLVTVKRMEQAFQRQVIYGGSLDTILLEMDLVPEERLVQYLALAAGLPPATRRETELIDGDALKRCAREVAQRYEVVPLFIKDGALRVLVRDPVDLGQLGDLANEINTAVQPLIVPEYCFRIAFDRAFGGQSDPRFLRLDRAATAAGADPAVGKSRSIIIEASGEVEAAEARGAASQVPGTPGGQEEGDGGGGLFQGADPGESTAEQHGDEPAATTAAAHKRAGLHGHREAQKGAPRHGAEQLGANPGRADVAPAEPMPAREAIEGRARRTTLSLSTEALTRHLDEIERVRRARADTARGANNPAAGFVPPPTAAPAASLSSTAPLSPAEAKAAFLTAAKRDEVFEILLRAMRSCTSYAGLLTIHGHSAVGRVAIAGDEPDPNIGNVLIPLDDAHAFDQASRSASPYIGPIATGDAEVDDMIGRLGGVLAPSALLLPVVLRDRVVALAVGHRGADALSIAEVSDLLPLAGLAAQALSRLIRESKAQEASEAADQLPRPDPLSGMTEGRATQGLESPSPRALSEPEITISIEDPDLAGGTQDSQEASEAADQLPRPDPLPGMAAGPATQGLATPSPRALSEPEITISIEDPDPAGGTQDSIEGILNELESDNPSLSEHALTEALCRPDEVLAALRHRFPGRLVHDRYERAERIRRASDHGPTLALVTRLGAASAELLNEKMNDTNRDVRYYATICAGELRPRRALPPLVERLFDADYGVRNAAINALRGYPMVELEIALASARRAIHSSDLQRVRAAAHALAELRDAGAIADLIDALGPRRAGSNYARLALVALTRQDHGSSARKWRSWWKRNQGRNRIEWLIDALVHRDEAMRQAAAKELRELTGEELGYEYDLPKKERAEAQERWRHWWARTGRIRFLREGREEVHRPTALLPRNR